MQGYMYRGVLSHTYSNKSTSPRVGSLASKPAILQNVVKRLVSRGDDHRHAA